jgi:hypothetical protein
VCILGGAEKHALKLGVVANELKQPKVNALTCRCGTQQLRLGLLGDADLSHTRRAG